MIELLSDPHVWASLLTLTALEIVLGIDNLIFLSIVSGRLPKHQQRLARQIGLALALLGRVALLFSLTWIIGLTQPIFSIGGFDVSWRDLVLIGGGAFLIVKGTMETHHMLEGHEEGAGIGTVTFLSAVVQIIFLDVVFALDSIITAVGLSDHLPVMVAAVVIAMIVMLVAANPVGDFVNAHPTVKMLALSFLLLVGMALVADGLHFHIPRGYLYAAIAFSAGVEALNLLAARARKKRARAPIDAAGRVVGAAAGSSDGRPGSPALAGDERDARRLAPQGERS
jgi:predicted tellurium resistance membrane protein TerC